MKKLISFLYIVCLSFTSLSAQSLAFNDVAELRQVEGIAEKVYLRGHTSVNDGGQGVFVWDPLSSETDDNGIFIKPTATTGAGRWVRLTERNVLNASFFGLNPSNSSPVNSSILNGLLQHEKATQWPVYVEPGLYFYDTTLLIDRSGVQFTGAGQTATNLIYQGDSNGINIISTAAGLKSVRITGFLLQGNNNSNYGLYFGATGSGPNKIAVRDLKIQNFRNGTTPTGNQAGLYLRSAVEVDFDNVQFFSNNDGVYINPDNSGSVTTVSFDRCSFSSNVRYGIYIKDGARGLTFEGNSVAEVNGSSGIRIVDSSSTKPIHDISFYNFWLESNNADTAQTFSPWNLVVETGTAPIVRNLFYSGRIKSGGVNGVGGSVKVNNATGAIYGTMNVDTTGTLKIFEFGDSTDIDIGESWNEYHPYARIGPRPRGASGSVTLTTDTNGDVDIPHNLKLKPTTILVNSISTARVVSIDKSLSTDEIIRARVYDTSGSPVVSTSVSLYFYVK